MIPGNPFSLAYDALWELAENSERLTSLVRLKNRIKFNHTGQSSPIKDEVSNTDLPELVLVSTASSGNLHETSNTSRITRQYEWIIATGDTRVQASLLEVEWALFAAMVNWPAVLGALRWPDDAVDGFCKRTNILGINSGLTDPERNRGIIGWSSIWAIEVEMHFWSAQLRQVGQPDPTTTAAPTTTL